MNRPKGKDANEDTIGETVRYEMQGEEEEEGRGSRRERTGQHLKEAFMSQGASQMLRLQHLT